MSMARAPERTRGTLPVISGPQSVGDVVKFTALAASLAIFVDAAVGHAMVWGNDPYWTYWVTDTLLMATVFGLGTAWFGMGLVKGALITAAHILALTVYYWSLSPIGLPSHPECLPLGGDLVRQSVSGSRDELSARRQDRVQQRRQRACEPFRQ